MGPIDAPAEIDLTQLAVQHAVAGQHRVALEILQADTPATGRKLHDIGDRP